MTETIINQVIEKLHLLPDSLQHKVLEFVETLQACGQTGVPGRQLLPFAGSIPSDELQMMRSAIEAGCERIDPNEW